MRSDSSRTARWSSPGGRDSSPGPTAARLRRAVTRQLFIPPSRGIGSGVPFPSRTRFQPETWYGKETTYTPNASCTIARMRSYGRGGKPLRGPRVRGDDRLRGDRLRAQAHGPPEFAFRAEALQRAARGDGHVPEFPREDAEGARGGRDRGPEGPPGSSGRGRVPPVAEGRRAVRGDPGSRTMGDTLGHEFGSSRGDAMSQFTSTNVSDVTFKRELQPEPSGSDPTRCPNCGSFALYVDPVRGERVCDNCGFVVDESLVDQGPDWTTFEGDDRVRAGPPPSVMAPDKGLGSMVGNGLRDAKGNPIG